MAPIQVQCPTENVLSSIKAASSSFSSPQVPNTASETFLLTRVEEGHSVRYAIGSTTRDMPIMSSSARAEGHGSDAPAPMTMPVDILVSLELGNGSWKIPKSIHSGAFGESYKNLVDDSKDGRTTRHRLVRSALKPSAFDDALEHFSVFFPKDSVIQTILSGSKDDMISLRDDLRSDMTVPAVSSCPPFGKEMRNASVAARLDRLLNPTKDLSHHTADRRPAFEQQYTDLAFVCPETNGAPDFERGEWVPARLTASLALAPVFPQTGGAGPDAIATSCGRSS